MGYRASALYPAGGYNQYAVERQPDGIYKVINHSSYANGSDNIYYTQRNEGRFVVVESRAPSGYYGDWTDVTNPGAAGSVLGKRAYAFEITKALDGQTLWLGNADYNADITTTNNGGTLIDTGEAIVTIRLATAQPTKPTTQTLPALPTMKNPTRCTLMATKCRTTAFSAVFC